MAQETRCLFGLQQTLHLPVITSSHRLSLPACVLGISLVALTSLRADLYWGGGSSNIANGTALPTTTAAGNGTWNATLQNWATSQSGATYGVWSNGNVANFGYYTDAANELITLGDNMTIGGLVFSNSPATTTTRRLSLNATTTRTITLTGAEALFLVTSSNTNNGLDLKNNVTFGASSTTLVKDGGGRFEMGEFSNTSNSSAFTGNLVVKSGVFNLNPSANLSGVPSLTLATFRSDPSAATAANGDFTTPIFSIALSNAASNRLSNDLAVTLRRGEFGVTGGGASSTETIGQIQLAPYGYLNTSGATAGTTLTLGNATAGIDRGSTGLGTMVIGINSSDVLPVNVVVSTPGPVATDVLLPWLSTSRAEFVQLASTNNTLTRIASTTASNTVSTWTGAYNSATNLRVNGTLTGSLGGNLTVNSYGILGHGTPSLLEIGAGNTLTINSGGITMAGSNPNRQYGFSNGTLTSGTNQLYLHTGVVTSSSLTVNSTISGTLDIIKTGVVAVTLGGTTANTYTGNLIVNSGELVASKSGAVTGAAFVRDGAMLTISHASALAATSNVTVDAEGVLNLGSTATLGGVITIYGGQIFQGNSDPTLNNNGFGLRLNGGSWIFNNNNTSKTFTLATNTSYDASSTASAVFSNISAGTGVLTINLNTGSNQGNAERVFQVADSSTLAAGVAEMRIEVPVANGGSGNTTGSIRKTGDGTLQILAPLTYTGGTVIDAGTLQLSSISRSAQSGLVGTTSTLSGSTKLVTFVEPIAGSFIPGQSITGTNLAAGAKIVDVLNDYQVALSTATSGAGSATNIATGALTRTGSLAGNVTINSGGTLLVDGNTTFGSGSSITVNSGGFLRLGANGTAGSIGTNSTLTANGTIVFDRSDTLVQGTDFGSGILGSGTLQQSGSGTTVLGGTNAFNGTVSVQSGTLVLSGGSAAGDSAVLTLANTAGATLSINSSETVGTLNGGGATGGTVHLASGQTLTLSGAASSTFAGQLQGAGGLSKTTGSGTLTLSGSNTNNGSISISAGTLVFDGPDALSSSLASLNATTTAATLSLADGTTRNSTISGSLNLDASAFRFDLNNTASDFLSVGGAAALTGGGKIQLNLIAAPAVGSSYNWDLISAAGGLSSDWTLDSSSFSPGDFTWSLSTVSGTTLRLTAAPSVSSLYWTGNASTLWSTAANWSTDSAGNTPSGSAPSGSSDVIFSAASAGNRTTTLGADTSIQTLRIEDPNNVSILGAHTLTLTGTGSSTISISAASGTTTINATLAGSAAGLVKSGAGTLVLNGLNSYGGVTTISGGTLQVAHLANGGSASSIGNSSQAATQLVIGSATLDYTGGNASTNRDLTISEAANAVLRVAQASTMLAWGGNLAATTGSLTLEGPGAIALSGTNLHSGGTTLASGTLHINSNGALGSGTFTIQGGSIDNTSGAPLSIANSQSWQGDYTFGGSNALTFQNVALAGNRSVSISTGTLTVAGSVSGGSLAKSGSGLLVLSGSNNYSGPLSVDGGALRIEGGFAIPDTGTIILANTAGASLTVSTNETIGSLRGGGLSGGNVSISANATLTVAESGNQSFSGAIGGAGNFTKSGAGTLTLNNSLTTPGTIRITGGVLATGGDGIFLSNATVVVTNATLRLGGNQTVASFNGDFNALDLTSHTFTIDGTAPSVIGGLISGAGGSLIKNGSSSLGIYQSNTYSGQTILNGGDVTVLNARDHFGTSSVTLNSGTITLGNAGPSAITTLSNLTLVSGTIRSGGNASSAINSNGTLTLQSGTISAPVTGQAAIIKTTAGTFLLSGNNSYSGGTTVSAGTLRLAGNGTLGSGGIQISNGELDLGGKSLANSISSLTGGLVSNGTLTANGGNFAVSEGTLSASLAGTNGLMKTGNGSVLLNASNTYSGVTTINAGTLQANASNALGSTANITVHGGSLLVSADNAIGNSTGINLAGGTLAFSGNVTDTIGALTLSANSVIDLGTGGVVAIFADLTMGNYTLAIHNWTGTTLWDGGTGNNPDQVYFNRALGAGELQRISFYSDFGSSFVGSGFQIMSGGFQNEIIAVPEPETWATAAMLIAGAGWAWMRRRRLRRANSDELDLEPGGVVTGLGGDPAR